MFLRIRLQSLHAPLCIWWRKKIPKRCFWRSLFMTDPKRLLASNTVADEDWCSISWSAQPSSTNLLARVLKGGCLLTPPPPALLPRSTRDVCGIKCHSPVIPSRASIRCAEILPTEHAPELRLRSRVASTCSSPPDASRCAGKSFI